MNSISFIDGLKSPPIVFAIFFIAGWLLIANAKKVAPSGEESPGKYTHYSCGEDLDAPSFSLNYHQFFRLALLFGVLHIVALVIATIPAESDIKILPAIYIFSAGVGMYILLERDESKKND